MSKHGYRGEARSQGNLPGTVVPEHSMITVVGQSPVLRNRNVRFIVNRSLTELEHQNGSLQNGAKLVSHTNLYRDLKNKL